MLEGISVGRNLPARVWDILSQMYMPYLEREDPPWLLCQRPWVYWGATRNSGRNSRLPHTACLLLYLGLSLLGKLEAHLALAGYLWPLQQRWRQRKPMTPSHPPGPLRPLGRCTPFKLTLLRATQPMRFPTQIPSSRRTCSAPT